MKRLTILIVFLCGISHAYPQIPEGYYDSANGLSGAELKTALFKIICNHNTLSYKELWSAYKTTDVKADGTIWDMYSSKSTFLPGSAQCSADQYKVEGDCYNREHSFPKSWFNDSTPMYTDLFHVIPTDGLVNGKRSNNPFGETAGDIFKSANGFSKLGASNIEGYTGTVFEPNDEYKGDFARIYFYMATAYEKNIPFWKSDMLAGNKYPAYKPWAINMLLRWAEEDPVSQKEIERNNAVYMIQGNRNPYVDHPEYADMVWGNGTVASIGNLFSYKIGIQDASFKQKFIPDWLNFNIKEQSIVEITGTPQAKDAGIHIVEFYSITNSDSTLLKIKIAVNDDHNAISLSSSATIGEKSYTETFSNLSNEISSYDTFTWLGDNGIKWSASEARTDQPLTGTAVCLGKNNGTYIETESIPGGCSRLTLSHRLPFSDKNGTLSIYVNNKKISTLDINKDVATDTIMVNEPNDFILRIENNGKARIAIDNVKWWEYKGIQNIRPNISATSISPKRPTIADKVTISAKITDDDGSIDNVKLMWHTSDGTSQSIDMTCNGTTYSSTIEPEATGTLFFTIQATDDNDSTSYWNQYIDISDINHFGEMEITQTPVAPTDKDVVTVSALIPDAKSADLYWGLKSSDISLKNPMTANGDSFTTTLFARSENSTVYYFITAKNAKGETITSDTINYIVTANTDVQSDNIGNTKVYPTPIGDVLNIELDTPAKIEIVNVEGKDIFSQDCESGNLQISTQNWRSGIYIVKIKDNAQTTIIKTTK